METSFETLLLLVATFLEFWEVVRFILCSFNENIRKFWISLSFWFCLCCWSTVEVSYFFFAKRCGDRGRGGKALSAFLGDGCYTDFGDIEEEDSCLLGVPPAGFAGVWSSGIPPNLGEGDKFTSSTTCGDSGSGPRPALIASIMFGGCTCGEDTFLLSATACSLTNTFRADKFFEFCICFGDALMALPYSNPFLPSCPFFLLLISLPSQLNLIRSWSGLTLQLEDMFKLLKDWLWGFTSMPWLLTSTFLIFFVLMCPPFFKDCCWFAEASWSFIIGSHSQKIMHF